MLKRTVAILSALFLAFGILSISVLRAASIEYSFSGSNGKVLGEVATAQIKIDYEYPYPGGVLPDHTLWPLKALRDRLWLIVTVNPGKKAELLLLFADKRIAASKILFERDKAPLAFSTLTKAEKYLQAAAFKEKENRKKLDTKSFLTKLAKAALKHRLTIREILEIAPEDAKPEIIKTENYAKDTYKEARDALNSLGMPVPENPFNGD
ncbi:MAG: DUF5667 domain-containing protein [Patescibacteria group bacterium]